MTYRHRTDSEYALIAQDLTDRLDLSIQEIADKHEVSVGPVRNAAIPIMVNLQQRKRIYDLLQKKAALEAQIESIDEEIVDATAHFYHGGWSNNNCYDCISKKRR